MTTVRCTVPRCDPGCYLIGVCIHKNLGPRIVAAESSGTSVSPVVATMGRVRAVPSVLERAAGEAIGCTLITTWHTRDRWHRLGLTARPKLSKALLVPQNFFFTYGEGKSCWVGCDLRRGIDGR